MELKFSKMTVDTSLAQEYLIKNNVVSELYNDYNGYLEKHPALHHQGVFKNRAEKVYTDNEIRIILWKLAANLKQNSELVVQLEYYFRNISVEDTKTQLNVLIQFIYSCLEKDGNTTDGVEQFNAGDPLISLSHVVSMMVNNKHQYIELRTTASETVAICHLFVGLCIEAGYYNLRLVCLDSPQIEMVEHMNGTVAVVAEDGDIDSAVDKFISSSKQAPWYLRKILVQESVYKQFKDALNWKCSLKKNDEKSVVPSILCSQALTYEGRTFLIDPVQVVEPGFIKQTFITVEAYRTTKEMMSILQQDEPRYLSLWINGIAQINEVTQSTKSPVVWVNNIGDIRGPPIVAQTLCPPVPYGRNTKLFKMNDKIAKLVKLYESWTKLDLESRRDILINVLEKCISSDAQNDDYSYSRDSVCKFTNDSFVQAGKDYTCTGTWRPVGFIGISAEYWSLSLAVELLLVLPGNALVFYEDSSDSPAKPPLPPYVELLEAAGVPVVYVGKCTYGKFKVYDYHPDSTGTSLNLQVIWTNSGTIFAN